MSIQVEVGGKPKISKPEAVAIAGGTTAAAIAGHIAAKGHKTKKPLNPNETQAGKLALKALLCKGTPEGDAFEKGALKVLARPINPIPGHPIALLTDGRNPVIKAASNATTRFTQLANGVMEKCKALPPEVKAGVPAALALVGIALACNQPNNQE